MSTYLPKSNLKRKDPLYPFGVNVILLMNNWKCGRMGKIIKGDYGYHDFVYFNPKTKQEVVMKSILNSASQCNIIIASTGEEWSYFE
jgi:hypothetical protein